MNDPVPVRRPRARRRKPPAPQPGRDALLAACIGGIVIVGAVAVADVAVDGKLDPSILALITAVIAPLTPALIVRSRNT